MTEFDGIEQPRNRLKSDRPTSFSDLGEPDHRFADFEKPLRGVDPSLKTYSTGKGGRFGYGGKGWIASRGSEWDVISPYSGSKSIEEKKIYYQKVLESLQLQTREIRQKLDELDTER